MHTVQLPLLYLNAKFGGNLWTAKKHFAHFFVDTVHVNAVQHILYRNVTSLILTLPAPKRVAAFPPNVIPADPVKNHRVKLLLRIQRSFKSRMQYRQPAITKS